MRRRAGIDLNTGERFNAAKGLGEAAFQRMVMNTARTWGWDVWHHHDSRRQVKAGLQVGDADARGFPDLVLVNVSTLALAFVELKRDRQYPTPAQRRSLQALTLASSMPVLAEGPAWARKWDVFLWRPRDWPAVEQYLTSGGRWPDGEPSTRWNAEKQSKGEKQ